MLRNSILRQTRLFSTSPITHKTLVESAKDTINKAAKTVSDATASGIAKTGTSFVHASSLSPLPASPPPAIPNSQIIPTHTPTSPQKPFHTNPVKQNKWPTPPSDPPA